jgi:hypothetical protein
MMLPHHEGSIAGNKDAAKLKKAGVPLVESLLPLFHFSFLIIGYRHAKCFD